MTAEHTKINSQIKNKNKAFAKMKNAIIDLENKLEKAKLKLAQLESELKELDELKSNFLEMRFEEKFNKLQEQIVNLEKKVNTKG